jgi:ribosome-associated protein
VIILKAQQSRSLEQNRVDGLARLQTIIDQAAFTPTPRRPTRPTRSSQRKRLDSKNSHGLQKVLRGKVVI